LKESTQTDDIKQEIEQLREDKGQYVILQKTSLEKLEQLKLSGDLKAKNITTLKKKINKYQQLSTPEAKKKHKKKNNKKQKYFKILKH
jgi:hypothetical protein